MYKQLAAYAMALIIDPTRYTAAKTDNDIIWGIDKRGGLIYSNVNAAKISILGALRFAQQDLGLQSRVYGKVYRLISCYTKEKYNKNSICDLTHAEAVKILRIIATS